MTSSSACNLILQPINQWNYIFPIDGRNIFFSSSSSSLSLLLVDLHFSETHSIRYRLNPIDCITTLSMSPKRTAFSLSVEICGTLIVVKCNWICFLDLYKAGIHDGYAPLSISYARRCVDVYTISVSIARPSCSELNIEFSFWIN